MARRWAIVLSVTATIAAIGLPVLASPAQSHESPAFTLDLSAKTQELRKKVKFSATATAASTLVADGKDIKETTKQLPANEKTEIKAELTQKFHHQVEPGDRVKIKGTATDQSGAAATDTVKAKVTDCPGRGQKADCAGR
jgi:uncharacterized cupredoxin-like copper-binding protein